MIYLCGMKIDKINQIIRESKVDGKDTSQVSDGYHTFEDLYSIRLSYNVALFNEWGKGITDKPWTQPRYDVHKSQRHHDGELCFGGGWFIVVANLPSGQISNHYEMKHWDLFRIPETEKQSTNSMDIRARM